MSKQKEHSLAPTMTAAQVLCATISGLSLLATDAGAQSAPTQGTLELQFSRYDEFQARADRMKINAPSLFVLAPLGERWAAQVYLTTDTMSGASPLYHDTLSGASGEGVEDFRKAGQFGLTHYFDRASVGLTAAVSDEDDYLAKSIGLNASMDSENRNRTYSLGVAFNSDRINPTNDLVIDQRKRGREISLGFTQLLDGASLVSLSAGFIHGEGYFNDPYKPLDRRPDARDETTFGAKYYRSFKASDGVLRANYRFYRDTWAVRGHTFELAYEQSLGKFAITPSIRYYTQSEADFYARPPFGSGFRFGFNYTADARLSSFGALEYGIKLALPEQLGFRPELKFAFYEQRQNLGLGEAGPAVELPSARTWQLTLKRNFEL